AEFVAGNDAIRSAVRWSLLPAVGLSWMALHLGPGATIAIIFTLLAVMSVPFLRRMRTRGVNKVKF
ncbi:MAG: hypothetical protein V3U56_08555, partial [Syntrophobacteria bacterium]